MPAGAIGEEIFLLVADEARTHGDWPRKESECTRPGLSTRDVVPPNPGRA